MGYWAPPSGQLRCRDGRAARLLPEQLAALLERRLTRRRLEALLIGLSGRGARCRRRAARLGQRAARAQAAADGVPEVDPVLAQQVLQWLGFRRRLDRLRLVDVGEVELQVEGEGVGRSWGAGRRLQVEAELEAAQELVGLPRVDVEVTGLDHAVEAVELAQVDVS